MAEHTQKYHVDRNAFKVIKVFHYLSEVDEMSGPLTYVKGSHKTKFKFWQSRYRWSDDEIHLNYGLDYCIPLTGSFGDVIIADTTGFHKGLKPVLKDRIMLTVTYGIHMELGVNKYQYQMFETEYNKMNEFQRKCAKYIKLV